MSVPPHAQQPSPDGSGTLLETEEEVRLALAALRTDQATTPAQAGRTVQTTSAVAYRPTLRAPTAVLTVCDDGNTEGEVIRLRRTRFVIGRTDGDLLLPHDGLISGRHVEITRQKVGDSYRWVIADLQTTNGLFVRVSRIALASGAEFLVGQGRYRFEASAPGRQAQTPAPAASASLIEVTPGAPGRRLALTQAECWIGSDPACVLRRAADPFVEARHVRLSRDSKGGWQAQNNKSLNGLWLRVPQVTVEDGCLFQIGEQRLRLKIGG